ncbi:hypothetical protein HID58_082824, partial [Brassica napus]
QRTVVGSGSDSFSQGLAEQIWSVAASTVLLFLPIARFLCFPVTQGVVEPLLKDHSSESGGVRDTPLRASVFRSTCQQISVTLLYRHVSSQSCRHVCLELQLRFAPAPVLQALTGRWGWKCTASLSIGKHQSLRRCGRSRESKTPACSSRVLVLHRLLLLLSDWTNSLILLNLLRTLDGVMAGIGTPNRLR